MVLERLVFRIVGRVGRFMRGRRRRVGEWRGDGGSIEGGRSIRIWRLVFSWF